MYMEPAAQVEGGVPGMGVLIENRPRRARAGAARKRAAPRAEITGIPCGTAKKVFRAAPSKSAGFSVQETTCDFLSEQPEQPWKIGVVRQKTTESSG